MIKIVTSKKSPALPSHRFLQASLCIQTSASQVLCDVDHNTKSWFWKYPPLNIAVMVAIPLSALNRPRLVAALQQGQSGDWSQLPSSLCLLKEETFAVLLLLELNCFFSLSLVREGSWSQNSTNYLTLPAIFLTCSVLSLRKFIWSKIFIKHALWDF